jgi:hypothetical protein
MINSAITVAAVAENREPFLTEATWLVHSLRNFGGTLADARCVIYFVDSLPADTAPLADLGAELKVVPTLISGSPHCNKIHMLLDDHAGSDWLVALDTDTIITGDFSAWLVEPVFSAKIVDQNPLPETAWRKLFAGSGLNLPTERYLTHFHARETIPYFNSGVLLLPEKDIARLGRTWLDLVPDIMAIYPQHPEIARHAFFTDQFALALALVKAGLNYQTLPLEMNFPTHIPVHPDFKPQSLEPLILHHHHKTTPEGYLAHCGYDNINRLINRFNKSL